MKKILSISALAVLLFPTTTLAVCPVCTVAVGAGLGLAEWLGIDDLISGLWIGALIVSASLWTINWLNGRKKLSFEGSHLSREAGGKSLALGKKTSLGKKIYDILIFLAYYALIILPLHWKGFIGKNPFNKFCGIDRLLFGIILGTVLFSAGALLHNWLRQRNNGKSYFKGQKIVMAISPLIIASIILYLTC